MNGDIAWMLLALGDDRMHQGNNGYADDEGSSYEYDSFVPNSKRLHLNDVVLVAARVGRSGMHVAGVAKIEGIEASEGVKDLRRCPACRTTKIQRRIILHPQYRCKCGFTFDEPEIDTQRCIRYTATYKSTWIKVGRTLSRRQVREAQYSPGDQAAVRPMRLSILAGMDPPGPELDILRRLTEGAGPLEEAWRASLTIEGMSAPHAVGLEWIASNAGRAVSWSALTVPVRLVAKPKGIYKPAGSRWPITIRRVPDGPHADSEITALDEFWFLDYREEARSDKFTNSAMRAALEDAVPVGVIERTSRDKLGEYRVWGNGVVVDNSFGSFAIVGPVPSDALLPGCTISSRKQAVLDLVDKLVKTIARSAEPTTSTLQVETRLLALLGSAGHGHECALCGRRLPTDLLQLEWIKPRGRCTEEERANPAAIIKLCRLGCAALLASGLVWLGQGGVLEVATELSEYGLAEQIQLLKGRSLSAKYTAARPYLEWHRMNVARPPAI